MPLTSSLLVACPRCMDEFGAAWQVPEVYSMVRKEGSLGSNGGAWNLRPAHSLVAAVGAETTRDPAADSG
jgi:hypothetical protein